MGRENLQSLFDLSESGHASGRLSGTRPRRKALVGWQERGRGHWRVNLPDMGGEAGEEGRGCSGQHRRRRTAMDVHSRPSIGPCSKRPGARGQDGDGDGLGSSSTNQGQSYFNCSHPDGASPVGIGCNPRRYYNLRFEFLQSIPPTSTSERSYLDAASMLRVRRE